MAQEVRIITEGEEYRRNKGTLIFFGVILGVGFLTYLAGRTFDLSFETSLIIGIILFIVLFILIKFRKKIFKKNKN